MPIKRQYNILVTGGAGFIGSHLVDALINEGHHVVVVDNLSTGKGENVNPAADFSAIDIRDLASLKELFDTFIFDYVFHLAAMARIPECLEKPIVSHEINVSATLHLLQLSRDFDVRGFVFSSSSAVYGEVKSQTPTNEDTPLAPISLYGLHKLTAEQYTLMYAKFYGLRASALRYFNVYGTTRQSEDGAYPNVFSAFNRDTREKGEVTIYGDGSQARDYVHVFDVVSANKRFMETDKAWGQVFNVGTGETHTVNEVARYFAPKRTSYQPARAGDPRYACADVSKSSEILGFKSSVSFEKGVDIYLTNGKENLNV